MSSKQKSPKIKSRNPVIKFDGLKMYFGKPYVIDVPSSKGVFTVHLPYLLDVIEIGYDHFFSSLNIITTNTTSYRLLLWDAGIDWNELSDFELFCMLYKQIDPKISEMLFGLNIGDFELVKNQEDIVVLYDFDKEIEINEEVYFHISQYFRKAFKNYPDEKLTKDKTLKLMYITKDRKHIEAEANKSEEEKNSSEEQILSLISSCINHPGFKYDLEGIQKMNVCQFFDSVSRLQIYESTTALLKGMYSGFMDSSKLSSDDYNFMKSI